MTTYTVASDGSTTPPTPPFPQSVINDVLVPDGTFDQVGAVVYADNTALTLQSLNIGSAIEVDLGFLTTPTLTGTGSITGSTDASKVLPSFVSTGGSTVDINGTVAVAFTSNGQLTVSAGERLALEADFFGLGASAVTVAAGGELDLDNLSTAIVSALASQGTVKVTAPTASFVGSTTLGGTVLVQGDAPNGFGTGVLAPRTTTAGNGAYVAALDLSGATLTAPINSLTLGTDASISFGAGTTSVARFAVTGSSTALAPRDLVNVAGTLSVTGDGSGAAQVTISQAEFVGTSSSAGAGLNTVDFAVAATDGGASLLGQVTVGANTTLRNDAAMRIGNQSATTATTIGAAAAATGSSFVNGVGARLAIAPGAALSVAAIENAGVITVSGNATFLQSLTNTGTVDVAAGTLALAAPVAGAGGAFTVENGATLSLDAASAQSVSIASGGTLRLSQPATFTGTLQLPAAGARLDLAGITATAATVSNGVITVTTSAGALTFAETGLVNGSSFALATDGAGGSLLTASAPATPRPVAYRFFDSVHGTQFLTTSDTERQTIQNTRPDLVYEGVGLNAVDPATDPAAAPVFRFFDTKFGTHFYTSSTTERDTVLATRPDLVNEGIGFYEHSTMQTGDSPVYRFFDSNFGTHFYTASATERATVLATRPDLIAEGVSFYAPA